MTNDLGARALLATAHSREAIAPAVNIPFTKSFNPNPQVPALRHSRRPLLPDRDQFRKPPPAKND